MNNDKSSYPRSSRDMEASYVANITLKKLRDNISFSRDKVTQADDSNTDEALASFQVLSLYSELLDLVYKATYDLRTRGPLTAGSAEDLKFFRELLDEMRQYIVDNHRCEHSHKWSKR